jgi:hypothetical protein
MKEWKVIEDPIARQPMSDQIMPISEVEAIRIAIYDNDYPNEPVYEKNRWVAEINLFVEGGEQIDLRQNLGTWRNHCYKIPKLGGQLDMMPWYNEVYAKAKDLDKTKTCVHGKLGKQMFNPDQSTKQFKKYMNVPGVFITYDYAQNWAHLFITEPTMGNSSVDFWEHHSYIDVELTKNSTKGNKHIKWSLVG